MLDACQKKTIALNVKKNCHKWAKCKQRSILAPKQITKALLINVLNAEKQQETVQVIGQ
jgi:hypothetical protein